MMSMAERRQLAAAISEHARFGEGLRAFLRTRDGGYVVMHGEVKLATIRATEASIPRRGIVQGNFLTAGRHWQRVADLVHQAEPELAAEHARNEAAEAARALLPAASFDSPPQLPVPMRRLERFPEATDAELVEACLEASRQIRLERQVAYDRAVVLECPCGELTLLPITAARGHLHLPFGLHRTTGAVKGAILMGEGDDPLPAMVDARIEDEEAVGVWACALLGFAAVTCFEPEFGESPVSQRQSPSRVTSPVFAGGGHPARSQKRTVPRPRSWPTHLEPIGEWVRYRGSFVAGHRRHLFEGRSASAEARERARAVGIALGLRETWVQPHTRGIPEDMEMRFRWRSPEMLDAR